MIVAISHAGDDHAPPVVEALRRLGAEVVLLDVGDFPREATIALEYGTSGDWTVEGRGGRIRAADVSAVWWRRPRPLEPDRRLHPADAGYALRQTNEALCGLGASLDVLWVNDPWRDEIASHKPLQIAAAERAGLRVPATLVTNDPERARAFVRARAGSPLVHKALHATPEDWHPTQPFAPEDVAALEGLRHAPVMFQEYVPGIDVRATVVGDEIYAAAIDARGSPLPHDFRPVFDAVPVERCELPAAVASGVRELVAGLGLRYAAIDLRRRDDGEHFFLEVNPGGQWLFVEERTGLPISEAIAQLLAGR